MRRPDPRTQETNQLVPLTDEQAMQPMTEAERRAVLNYCLILLEIAGELPAQDSGHSGKSHRPDSSQSDASSSLSSLERDK